ncbi:ribosomal protein S18 acetylase RimI-like enzyme [Ulvibacter sp. MAR_2010_11]|uniref:GNAT family N-acetyltransferase n=1 Tax=Ulvibacter sp. MAR_2010_11 TaxID=1250229 RepID=UPI000C2B799E|nr:GNAT family N-acetyltransferase [Ulvibacter sp. MAR_2010_11]PKA82997.1 ribosomal protein S18 acetylase RimI-like enzyme [Ulvibacter sp. MAR_2010_11]
MIRHAKPSEIEKIITITRACAAKMVSENIFQWNEFYPNKEAFQKDMVRNELYVLLHAEEIVGCIVISSVKDAEYDDITWLTKDSAHYYIHRLAVNPQFQGRGCARLLMDFAEKLGRENNKASIRLDTFSQNLRNQKFYEARGYQRLGNIFFPKQSQHPFYCYELVLSHQ